MHGKSHCDSRHSRNGYAEALRDPRSSCPRTRAPAQSPSQSLAYARTLEYREHDSDAAKQQKHWTQAIVRFRSLQPEHSEQPALIDLVEYYWAPIINGRVKALQSLQFLIRSALTPFDYLRENLVAIAEVSDDQTGKTIPRAVQEGLPATSNGEILHILIRELARSVFIFFPMLLFVARSIFSSAAPCSTRSPPNRTPIG